MAQISYIKKSDLLNYSYGYQLFSPTYFQNNKLKFWKLLEQKSSKSVEDCFNQVDEIENSINENVICYDLSHAITKFLQDGNETSKIESSKKVAQNNDFIISRLRSYLGQMCIVIGNSKKQLFSTEFLIFRSKNQHISTHTLFVFCMTKYVQTILQMSQYGTEHPRFYDFILEKLPLPHVLFEIDNSVSEMVKSAHQKQTQSKQLYKEAEQLLLIELGLLNYEVRHSLWFTTTKNEINKAKRYDSEYFQPKYAEIIKKIENYEGGWDFLKNLTTFINNGNQPPYVKNGEIRFFSQKWIKDRGIDYSFLESTEEPMVSKDFFDDHKNKTSLIHQGDILYYSVGANLGFCHNYLEAEPIAVGSFINIIRADKSKVNEIYLGFVINSIIGRMQGDREKSGIAQPYIYAKNLRTFKIPLIKPEIQKQIAEKIQESHKLRKESKALLEEAKRKVEEEIEKT